MKILQIIPYSPVPANFGGALRIYNILRYMVQHHEVSIVMFGSPRDKKNLEDEFGNTIRECIAVQPPWQRTSWRIGQLYSTFRRESFFQMLAVNHAMQKTLDALFDRSSFDIVQTEFSHTGAYHLDTDAVKIIDAHNVEYDNFRRMSVNARSFVRKFHYSLEYKKLYRDELVACRKQDALFVTSERDKELFQIDLPGTPIYVVPNGVDSSYFTPDDGEPEPWSMVFTGMMAYVPNYDGMLYFLDEIFPLILKKVPQAKIYIVGNRPPKQLLRYASDQILISGYTEDVRPFVRRASVYVVPLRMGSGTRLKIVEAFAMKKPIVTTSIGCEGIDVVPGESALIADEPGAFAESVVRLMRDADLRCRLASNGYALMRSSYEWSVIWEKIETHYRSLLNNPRTPHDL